MITPELHRENNTPIAPWQTKFGTRSLFGFRIALVGLFPWLEIIDIGANFPICNNELANFTSNPENK
jgi:hypothetical protein